jgi:ATP-dependent DNA helicase DinG
MPLDVEKIAAELSPGGAIARRLPTYEPRVEQVTMARAVARTLEHGGVLVVEAGTGTGKSLAYLIPSIHWARQRGERVIVSTRTINLQEQLIHTDLPFLARNLGVEFGAALVKGRGNYLCLRKTREISEQPSLLGDEPSRAELATILRWSHTTEDGSLSDLGFAPRASSWEAVRVEHDDCLRARCPEYEQCFFYRARRAAARADVLVVNHSLLMADQALRDALADDEQNGILPRASRLVIDEAHHIEDVSTEYFGADVTLRRIEQVLSRLQSPRTPERGVLPSLLERLAAVSSPEDRPAADGAMRWLEERLRPRVPELAREAAAAFGSLLLSVQSHLRAVAAATPSPDEQTLRVVPLLRETSFWTEIAGVLSTLVSAIEAFVEDTRPVLRRVGDFSAANAERFLFPSMQLDAQTGRLAAVAEDLRSFLLDDPALCRWFALRTDRDRLPVLSLHHAPVEVGPKLRSSLFERFQAVILTSATLAVDRRFDYFFDRSGIGGLDPDHVSRLRLPSPFDYSDQALLAVPDDLPDPDAPGHEDALHGAIARVVETSRGGAFVLFTSYGSLARAHGAVAERLRARGIEVLRQGDADRHRLLDRFRASRSAALFGTDSFWEGVDVRGEGLRVVAIARLPFRVPTEPIQQARMEAIEARGGNPFAEYGLPQAVIKLRQGFGRLIRSRQDTGVVLLLDSRIVRRRYGETFLDSLPPARLVVGPAEIVFSEIERFLRGVGG